MKDAPSWKKRRTCLSPPPPPSLLSLPDVIILNCLARIPKAYYPILSVVSKAFRDLVLSLDLNHARFHHKTQEPFFSVCLQFPDDPDPSWFTLYIKPDEVNNKKKKMSTLVQVPSSYASSEPLVVLNAGSDVYALKQNCTMSSLVIVRNKDNCLWRKAPNMMVSRVNPVACVLDEKIYVMGGCEKIASVTTWGEVFDIKTQTWKPLPDPGDKLRFSSTIKRVETYQGMFYVRSNDDKDSLYDPRKGKWEVVRKALVIESRCYVDNVLYSCRSKSILWYDTEIKDWVVVKGLSSLNKSVRRGLIETASYNGKLLVLWDKFAQPGRHCEDKSIWCALVSFEKRQDGRIWGKVEWSNIVLTVPRSYLFLRSSLIRC